jgi:ketosteroid isomerase-like protein
MTSTSPATDNGRTIAGMYAAFGRGDVGHVLAQMAPDVDWIETDAADIPTHGRFGSRRKYSRMSSPRFPNTSNDSSFTPSYGSRPAMTWS